VIVVVCGQPFSGKTEYAARLAWEWGGIVIDANDFRGEPYLSPSEYSFSAYNCSDYTLRDGRVVEAVSKLRALMPVPIIITGTFAKRNSRRYFTRDLRKIDPHIRCVWVNTPWEECVRRGAEAGMDIARWKLDFRRPNTGDGWENVFETTIDQFRYPNLGYRNRYDEVNKTIKWRKYESKNLSGNFAGRV